MRPALAPILQPAARRLVPWACCVWLLAAPAVRGQPAPSTPLAEATPGAVVTDHGLELGESSIPVIPVTRSPGENVSLLLSDKPEYFRTGDGIAMRETVPAGRYRFYLYHVPEPTGDEKVITAVVENRGSETLTVEIDHATRPEPSGNYHAIGKAGLVGFLEGEETPDAAPARTLTLAPGERSVLDPALEEDPVVKDDLVHAIYALRTDGPARFTVLQREPDADSVAAVDELPLLPQVLPGHHPSGAGRGLFPGADFTVAPAEQGFTYRTSEGPMQVVLADGDTDPWMEGFDSISESPIQNKGNYGATYRLRIPWESDDGRDLALLVYNARAGGQWCGFQATALTVDAGRFPAGVVQAPAEETRYGAPPQAVLLQRYAAGDDGFLDLTFSPPGASCLPVPIVLLPLPAADG